MRRLENFRETDCGHRSCRKMAIRQRPCLEARWGGATHRTSRTHHEPPSCRCGRGPTQTRSEVRSCEALDWQTEGCQDAVGCRLIDAVWIACHLLPKEPWPFHSADPR